MTGRSITLADIQAIVDVPRKLTWQVPALVLGRNQWKFFCRSGLFDYTDEQIDRAYNGDGLLGSSPGFVHIVSQPIPTTNTGGNHV
jgi:hypothetical protein